MIDKKKAKEQYKNRKIEIGSFIFRSNNTGITYMGCDTNPQGTVNRIKFQLGANLYENKQLQEEWNSVGEQGFFIEVALIEYTENDGTPEEILQTAKHLVEQAKKYNQKLVTIK